MIATAIQPDNGNISKAIELESNPVQEYVFKHHGVKTIYNCVPKSTREAVSAKEFEDTVLRVNKTLNIFSDYAEDNGWDNFDLGAIAVNIKQWAIAHESEIRKIKECPSYDPAQPWKIISPVSLEREIDKQAIRDFGLFISGADNFPLNEESKIGLCNFIRYLTHQFLTEEDINIFNTKIEAYPEKFGNLGLLEAKPVAGQKVSKFIRKVLTRLGAFDKAKGNFATEMERAFAKYADAINPTIFERTGVLSIDPVDFLLASNGISYSSCYWINKYRPGSYQGQCSAGTWSYMASPYAYVLYSPTENEEAIRELPLETREDIAFRKKVYRQMVFFNGKDVIVNSRMYPQSNDADPNNSLYRDFRAYAQKMISAIFNIPNYWTPKLYNDSNNPFVRKSYDFLGYFDPEYFSTWAATNKATYQEKEDHKPMEIGGSAVCPVCGDYLGDNRYICTDCDENRKRCVHCGRRVCGDEGIWCNDDWYCSDCVTYDDYLDEYYPAEGIAWSTYRSRRGYEYNISEYGLERALDNGDIIQCAECGELFRSDCDLIDTPNGYVCPSCFDYNYFRCEECGEIFAIRDVRDENYNFTSEITGEYLHLCDECGDAKREKEKETLELEAIATDNTQKYLNL